MSKFCILSNKEQAVYDRAGVGEKGEQAVLNRRQYINDYYAVEAEYAREKKRCLFMPKNEKSTVTLETLEDDYDE